jgi:hypothetical protein
MPADPGGVFKSDEHRRVLANCASRRTLEQVTRAVFDDTNSALWPQMGDSAVEQIVNELRSEGLLKKPDSQGLFEITAKGRKMLQQGHPNAPKEKSS